MICGNIEEGQLIHPGGYGVEWVGRRILLREVELILKGPLRNLPCDEDGGWGWGRRFPRQRDGHRQWYSTIEFVPLGEFLDVRCVL